MATFVSMATCHTCNKTTRYSGVNRDFLGAFTKGRGTPGSNGKRKSPQVAYRGSPGTPKMAGKEKTPGKTPIKTPSKTPRSSSSGTPGSSSSSSSSKTPSGVKKWVVQRLSKMLHRDQKPSSKTGTLKDFLSSL